MALVESRKDRPAVLTLVAEGFDMLEEDYLEEQFFTAVRRAYWASAAGSPARAAAQEIIGALEF
jgi:hypothetical protein